MHTGMGCANGPGEVVMQIGSMYEWAQELMGWQKAKDEVLDSRWWLVFIWNSLNFYPWVDHLHALSAAL